MAVLAGVLAVIAAMILRATVAEPSDDGLAFTAFWFVILFLVLLLLRALLRGLHSALDRPGGGGGSMMGNFLHGVRDVLSP